MRHISCLDGFNIVVFLGAGDLFSGELVRIKDAILEFDSVLEDITIEGGLFNKDFGFQWTIVDLIEVVFSTLVGEEEGGITSEDGIVLIRKFAFRVTNNCFVSNFCFSIEEGDELFGSRSWFRLLLDGEILLTDNEDCLLGNEDKIVEESELEVELEDTGDWKYNVRIKDGYNDFFKVENDEGISFESNIGHLSSRTYRGVLVDSEGTVGECDFWRYNS